MLTISTANQNAINNDIVRPVEFIKIELSDVDIIRVTNYTHDVEFDTTDGSYASLGGGLEFSSVADNAEAKDDSFDIRISGVQSSFRSLLLGTNIKGSPVTFSRGFIVESTGLLADDPIVKWRGRVSDYNMSDVTGHKFGDSTTISISCRSLADSITDKVSGRNTSPTGLGDFGAFTATSNTIRDNFGAD